ncbi:hypothetical protein [Flavobacterium daejeonense]|uniref:hypothetical protein n=1 Tax=Flavobacterium daejeonense TaxID=350893 RepID=UPI00047B6CEB|nr:hypothetical protein [Flavobacterium daejeonense]
MLQCFVIILFTISLYSQSYVEALQFKYTNAFQNQLYNNSVISTFEINSELPIAINKDSYLFLSPSYSNHQIKLDNTELQLATIHSLRLPIGVITAIGNSKWSLTALGILSSNGMELFKENSFQFGTILFTTFSKNPNKKIRLGVYVNKEFFGWFVIPVAGVNWQINNSNAIFGLLPGRLTFEHKWNSKLYSGLTFRAPMNSYRINDQRYITLYDNQLSLFLDYYLTKPICITFESGWGLFRKIRTSTIENNIKTNETNKIDGTFIRLCAAYRLKI